jgi:hypothetical protein
MQHFSDREWEVAESAQTKQNEVMGGSWMAGVRLLDGVHAKGGRMVLIEIEVTSGISRSFL